MPRSVVPAALVLGLVAGTASAAVQMSDQERRDAAVRRLTGGTQKEWIFKQFIYHMGPGNRCKEGETYLFYANGSAVLRVCENGQETRLRRSWTLELPNRADVRIRISNDSYLLLFSNDSDTARVERMILRTPSAIRPEYTVDKRYVRKKQR